MRRPSGGSEGDVSVEEHPFQHQKKKRKGKKAKAAAASSEASPEPQASPGPSTAPAGPGPGSTGEESVEDMEGAVGPEQAVPPDGGMDWAGLSPESPDPCFS